MFRKISKADIPIYVQFLNKFFFGKDSALFAEAEKIFAVEERVFNKGKTKTYLVPFLHKNGCVNLAIFTIYQRKTTDNWYKGDHIYLSMETASQVTSILKTAQVLYGRENVHNSNSRKD